jgi:hypothetical protein
VPKGEKRERGILEQASRSILVTRNRVVTWGAYDFWPPTCPPSRSHGHGRRGILAAAHGNH